MEHHRKFPRLRWPLDIRMERVESGEVLLLRCPLGISPEPLLLVPAVGPLIASFDGKSSLDQILSRFAPHGLRIEMLEKLVSLLDERLFLDGPPFEAAREVITQDFLSATVREAALAGLSYAAEAGALRAELDSYLLHRAQLQATAGGPLLGLVAPHIDYRRGSICYGKTYNHLHGETHDLYVLIGTSHQYSEHMFHLTAKDFMSPLGALPADREFVQLLAARYGFERSFADELLHRREHSLELQVPFLRHLKSGARIVPILVGSFHNMLESGRLPSEFDQYENFAAALTECLKVWLGRGQRVIFIAGVDMAHIGRAFGDSGNLTPLRMEQIRERDEVYLDAILRQDKLALFTHIQEDGDARRICGFPTMYTVLDVLDRLGVSCRGELLEYRQAVDYQSDCAVTFAGIGLRAVA